MNTQHIDIKADIRERLLHVAIRLFAEKGIDAVSMRAINTAAGSKNKSAVHYHFGNKEGILEAIFEFIDEKTAPLFDELLTRVEQRSQQQSLSVPEILMSYYLPLYAIYTEAEIGPHVIKLLSKMMIDSRTEYKNLFNDHFQKHMHRLFELIKKQLPEKNEQILRFQLIHSFMETITGIATIDLMDSTPLGDIRFEHEIDMMSSYLNYVCGGLTGNEQCLDQVSEDFWADVELVFSSTNMN